jgi:uncharacterized protein involved in exopolysaccharide biosynthesis
MSYFGGDEYDKKRGQFSLRDVLTIVFKRRVLISVFAVSTIFLIMALSLLKPRTYEVSATLLVTKSRAEVPIAPTETSQLIDWISEQELNSEIEILNSRSLLEEVVESLGSEENRSTNDGWKRRSVGRLTKLLGGQTLSDAEGLVIEMQKKLLVSSIRRTNAIRISLRSRDAEWATRVVGTLTEKYLERRVEAFQSPQVVAFFEEQMVEAESRLKEYEGAIQRIADGSSVTVMKDPEGTDSLETQKHLAMQRLAQLEGDLGVAEVDMQEQIHEVASLRGRLMEEPERLPTANRNNVTAETEEIEVALATLRLQRDGLLQDFKPDSRYVRDIETQIEMAEKRLNQIDENGIGVNGTEPNTIYLGLKSQLLRAEAELEGTRAEVSSLRRLVSEKQKDLADLSSISFELDALGRDAQATKEDYLLYRKKYEEARISAAMDQKKFLNVTVIQPAQLPMRPLPRGLLMKAVMALLAGVAGGFGVAFGLEFYLDRSFTTGEDVERKLGIQHIASIPEGEMVG